MINNKREICGVVSSDKMNKTVVVKVERKIKHFLYGKFIKKTTKYYAHDEKNICKIGDIVIICETKPFSKKKSWVVLKVN